MTTLGKEVKNNHEHGTFCWVELVTNDPIESKQFYSRLFDWAFFDQAIGHGLYFTTILKEGKEIGALYKLESVMPSKIAPHWLPYIAIDDVDKATALAREYNARVLVEGTNISDSGRLAMLKEQRGAMFSLWQADKHPGIRIQDVHGTPYWIELTSMDASSSVEFYSNMFGWEVINDDPNLSDYTLFVKNGEQKAGLIQMKEHWESYQPEWTTYFLVDNCEAAAEQAIRLGGVLRFDPSYVPGIGTFTNILDPQGARFSIIEPVK